MYKHHYDKTYELKNNDDKGSAIVIMDIEHYKRDILSVLQDMIHYEKVVTKLNIFIHCHQKFFTNNVTT